MAVSSFLPGFFSLTIAITTSQLVGKKALQQLRFSCVFSCSKHRKTLQTLYNSVVIFTFCLKYSVYALLYTFVFDMRMCCFKMVAKISFRFPGKASHTGYRSSLLICLHATLFSLEVQYCAPFLYCSLFLHSGLWQISFLFLFSTSG